ncbi:MAG: DsbA family protein, partial [Actinomycetes bacterium]
MVGAGSVAVDAYIDFQCPFCRMFEEQSGPTLRRMVAERLISLVYHPLAFLDALSTNHYSSRGSSSSGCAADG